MELNREQIIKALECCIKTQCENCCNLGSWHEQWNCMTDLMKKAVSLIKELTEESQKWQEAYDCADSACRELSSKCDELTEENERLKSVEFTCGFVKPHKVLECPIFDEIVKAKADTVRKMQERLKEKSFSVPTVYNAHFGKMIDQIAKEILNQNN